MLQRNVEHDEDGIATELMVPLEVRAMVRLRCEEHARLKQTIATQEARCALIATEVETLLSAAGCGAQLLDGIDIDGHKLKLVAGETAKLNYETLIRLGCDPQWITQATVRTPRKVHVRFTHRTDVADPGAG